MIFQPEIEVSLTPCDKNHVLTQLFLLSDVLQGSNSAEEQEPYSANGPADAVLSTPAQPRQRIASFP